MGAPGMPKSVRWQADWCPGTRSASTGRSCEAAVEGERAAGVERAALGRDDRARQFAARGLDLAAALGRIELGRGVEQRLGIGMARRGEQRLGRPDLDDLAQIHHRDAVRDVPHQPQVVGDEHHGQLQPAPAAPAAG